MKKTDLTKLKLAKGLPEILQTVHVKGGVATTYNLSGYMRTQCAEPDGLYTWQAWKSGRAVQSMHNAEDYTELEAPNGEHIGTIDTEHIKSISGVLSYETRFNLYGLIYIPGQHGSNRQLLVGTDGHRLHYAGDLSAPQKNGVILSRETCELLTLESSWTVLRSDKWLHFVSMVDPGNSIGQFIIDQKFPNYASVIPKKGDKIGDENLIDFMSHFHREKHKLGARSRNNGFYIKVNNGQFVCEMEVPDVGYFISHGPMYNGSQEVMMAFNGEYIADIDKIPGPKSVMWTANDECLHVKTESGGCVVMPLSL